jgi:hypothetical protein
MSQTSMAFSTNDSIVPWLLFNQQMNHNQRESAGFEGKNSKKQTLASLLKQ